MNLVLFATLSLTPIFFGGGICNFDNRIKRGSAKRLSNNPIAPLEDNKSSVSDVILSQNPTNIINYVKQKLNPNINNHEDNQSNKESIKKTVQKSLAVLLMN